MLTHLFSVRFGDLYTVCLDLYLPDVFDDVLDVGGVLVGDLGGHDGDLEDGEGAEADEPPVHVLLLDERHRRAAALAALHVDVIVVLPHRGCRLAGAGGGDAHHLHPPVVGAAARRQRLQLRPPVDHRDHRPEVGRLPVQWDHQLTCQCASAFLNFMHGRAVQLRNFIFSKSVWFGLIDQAI
jgi:hypothetical protein